MRERADYQAMRIYDRSKGSQARSMPNDKNAEDSTRFEPVTDQYQG